MVSGQELKSMTPGLVDEKTAGNTRFAAMLAEE
jgi:hypothetical protein